MPKIRLLIDLAALAAASLAVAFLHHGHIGMFLTDIHERLEKKRTGRLRDATIVQEPSRIFVRLGDPLTRYEVIVHRKSRSIEVGLQVEGERDEDERIVRLLAERAPEIRARLGAGAELEEVTRTRSRLSEHHIVPGDDWRPKRDLTAPLAREITQRLVAFVRVLEPMLRPADKATKAAR